MFLRIIFASLASVFAILSAQAQPINGHYIVRMKDGVDPATVANGYGIAPKFVYSQAINGLAAAIPPGILARLQNDPRVESISADNLVYAIGKPGSGGGGGGTTSETLPEGVKRIG